MRSRAEVSPSRAAEAQGADGALGELHEARAMLLWRAETQWLPSIEAKKHTAHLAPRFKRPGGCSCDQRAKHLSHTHRHGRIACSRISGKAPYGDPARRPRAVD